MTLKYFGFGLLFLVLSRKVDLINASKERLAEINFKKNAELLVEEHRFSKQVANFYRFFDR